MSYKEVFITGTEPTEFCDKRSGALLTQKPPASWLSHIFGGGDKPKIDNDASALQTPPSPPAAGSATCQETGEFRRRKPASQEPDKKPGLLRRIFGIFGGSKTDQE